MWHAFWEERTVTMSHRPSRVLSPGASQKRRETEVFYIAKPSPSPSPPPPTASAATSPSSTAATATTTSSAKAAEPISSNQLLAGYMAYEFLTKGTFLGQKWEPSTHSARPKRARPIQIQSQSQIGRHSHSAEAEPSPAKRHPSYAEVANLLKGNGAHIPGIVNPTQLVRWIQM